MGEDMKKTIVMVYDKAVISGGAAKIAIQSAVELAKNPDNNVIYFAANAEVDELGIFWIYKFECLLYVDRLFAVFYLGLSLLQLFIAIYLLQRNECGENVCKESVGKEING